MGRTDKKIYAYKREPVFSEEENEGERASGGGDKGGLRTYLRVNPELSVYESGWEKCSAGHSYGPAVREFYLLHYIVSGRGTYTVSGRTSELGAGQFFLIPPAVTTFYRADDDDPWFYSWVGFNGLEAERLLRASGFSEGEYILSVRDPDRIGAAVRAISQYTGDDPAAEYGMLGQLYLLFSLLMRSVGSVSDRKENDDYVSNAIKYINENFAQPISVAETAYFVGLDRSYFYRLFKASLGVSPQEYLLGVRFSHAEKLLQEAVLPLGAVAETVGYPDYGNFCKAFRRRYGVSPRRYRAERARNPCS